MRCRTGKRTLSALAIMLGALSPAVFTQGRGGQAPAAPQLVAIRAGRLFDGKTTTTSYALNQVILIKGDRIVEIG